MYSHIELEKFIKDVNDLAEKAAQKIYDHYTPELIEIIKRELKKGDEIISGNGISIIKNKNGIYIHENYPKFHNEIESLNYTSIRPSFNLPDFKKL